MVINMRVIFNGMLVHKIVDSLIRNMNEEKNVYCGQRWVTKLEVKLGWMYLSMKFTTFVLWIQFRNISAHKS